MILTFRYSSENIEFLKQKIRFLDLLEEQAARRVARASVILTLNNSPIFKNFFQPIIDASNLDSVRIRKEKELLHSQFHEALHNSSVIDTVDIPF